MHSDASLTVLDGKQSAMGRTLISHVLPKNNSSETFNIEWTVFKTYRRKMNNAN